MEFVNIYFKEEIFLHKTELKIVHMKPITLIETENYRMPI